MLNDARPVRIVAMSCCRSESAFSILVLMLASTSFTELNTGPLGAACCSFFIAMCLRNAFRLMNYSADGFPIDICIIPACIPESSFVSRTNRLPEETVRAKGKRRTGDRCPREGPWEVMTPRSSCPGGESTPLRGANLRLIRNKHSNPNRKPDLPIRFALAGDAIAPGQFLRGSVQAAWVIFGKPRWITSAARRRRVLGKHEMSSILMVVRDEFTAQSPDVRFIECNHMIEAFSAGGTDHRSA